MTNIKEVIHLYLGCEVRAAEGSMTYTLSGIDRKGNALFYDEHGNEMWLPEGWKIVLRRLDSMELADMKLWIDRCTELGLKPIDISDNELRLAAKMFNKKGFGAMDLSSNPELVPHLIAHLLKQGFWLFGDEAFEQGLIIDKNLKP